MEDEGKEGEEDGENFRTIGNGADGKPTNRVKGNDETGKASDISRLFKYMKTEVIGGNYKETVEKDVGEVKTRSPVAEND